jgi:hypothetical protein
MPDSIPDRVPVVGGLGYIERVRPLPSSFAATLHVEPENRYFRHAIAVRASGEKVGYVAPEIACELVGGGQGCDRGRRLSCPTRGSHRPGDVRRAAAAGLHPPGAGTAG